MSAKRSEALSEILEVCYRRGQHRRREIVVDHVPGSADGFIAVTRLFGCYYFAPSRKSTCFDTDKDDKSRVDRSKARFERFVHRSEERRVGKECKSRSMEAH